ncbi:hypothetical protein BT96DRAFT_1006435 [Gymnopus androsaceus JB14]|uniref:DUF6589 domain-containing protein n=1 Tax=Gymnopus androsaceus JB14 TaxID=1447944 RepID=A0A6A4GL63_9AGAR|nr:hypothetical protein BT96DRAFT_1006435 [Gymnopus androsaceus JB14]
MPSLNVLNYTLLSQSRISTPLYPFGMLPSPVTPSTSTTQALSHISNQTPSEFNSSTSETSLAPLWGFNSDPLPPLPATTLTHPNTEQWMSLSNPSFSHTQPRLWAKKLTFFASYLQQLPPENSNISLGISKHHRTSLQAFLQGKTAIKPVEIIEKMYHHCYSYPSSNSKYISEREHKFSPYEQPSSLWYTRVSLSSWATQLLGNHVYRSIGNLLCDSPKATSDLGLPHIPARLVASANEQTKAKGLMTLFKARTQLAWYLTECMAAPRKSGVIVERKHWKLSMIQVAAIQSFLLCQNQYVNGYLAMHMGIWHIACGSHVDVKHAYSHLATSVHETTARRALEMMGETSIKNLQKEVGAGQQRWQVLYCFVLDNIQEFQKVWEGGLGRENHIICGTACTVIGLDDCADNAFDFIDRFIHILKNERAKLTTMMLYYDSINWTHIQNIQTLHSTVSKLFHSNHAIHCMRDGCKIQVVPLGSNAECKILTPEMVHAIHDFCGQAGVKPEFAPSLITWAGGDGGSVLAILHAQKLLATMYDPSDPESDYKILHNLLLTTGIWHTQATSLNTIAANHYGPLVTNDPSALSKSAACAEFKRPSNFKDCSNYYHLSRSMTTFWETQVLDCWRLKLGLDHWTKMKTHFENLASTNSLPDFEWFTKKAECIIDKYMSFDAYKQALSQEINDSAPDSLKFPIGNAWSPSNSSSTSTTTTSNSTDPVPTAHVEQAGFTAAYAIPEGDIGCDLQFWIFLLSGGSNNNYVNILLEMYCLFHYESSKELKDAIWNNWLVNVTGELGKWIPDDLLQEHHNRWLEDMVQKSGGTFDNTFLWKIIPPNVKFFLRLKEQIKDEFKQLLTMHGNDTLHFFYSRCSMGHAAVSLVNGGFNKLDNGQLQPTPSGSNNLPQTAEPNTISISSSSSSENESHSGPASMAEDDELEPEVVKELSQLEPGPELMPTIDPDSGRLIQDWLDANDGESDEEVEEDDDAIASSDDEGYWLE